MLCTSSMTKSPSIALASCAAEGTWPFGKMYFCVHGSHVVALAAPPIVCTNDTPPGAAKLSFVLLLLVRLPGKLIEVSREAMKQPFALVFRRGVPTHSLRLANNLQVQSRINCRQL